MALEQRTRAGVRTLREGGWPAAGQFWRWQSGQPVAVAGSHAVHIQQAADWLCRAQDAVGGRGVSWGYDLLRGWRPAYPETTGYLIPTFYDLSQLLDRPELAERAARMADWECDVQLETGAVMAGTVDTLPLRPAIFNTGQVLQGWARAIQETGNSRFIAAAERAGQWMLDCQDDDGAFRRGLSPKVAPLGPRSYNVRSAWGLLQAGQVLGRHDFVEAARRCADWTLRQQQANGWFAHCCLSDARQPLTHTLAYTCRGLLELGLALEEPDYVAAALKGALPLAERIDEQGGVAGRFDDQWRPTVRWSCLTGQCQLAIIWLKLWQLGRNDLLRGAAERALAYVKARQSGLASYPEVCGAIAGSSPLTGEYARLRFPNWAAKFFVDALCLLQQLEATPRPETHPAELPGQVPAMPTKVMLS